MMRKILMSLALVAGLASCDSGDIMEQTVSTLESGRTVKLTARLSGLESLNDAGYALSLAGFEADGNYAVMQRTIPATQDEVQEINVVMSNIARNISTVELNVSNSLRKRYLSLSTIQMDEYADAQPTDTIYMDLGQLDVSLFGALQEGVFNQACIMCHGGNGRKAGNLDLTQGNAFANLVDHASTQKEGYTRVKSGDADNSLLNIILNEGGENALRYNHTEVVSSQFKDNLSEVRLLLRQWINGLGND